MTLEIWMYTLGSVFIVSLISLVGLFFLSLRKKVLDKILLFLVSFAIGALVGDAFLHLLPESIESGTEPFFFGVCALAGLLVFFVIEKILRWQHRHLFEKHEERGHKHKLVEPYVWLNLFGDGVHNFVDGVLIAGSYMASIPLGVTTTIAVLFHEGAQEMGDFAVLIKGGMTRMRALLANFISALVAVVGAVLTLLLGSRIANLETFLIPATFAGFLYLAMATLIPELHEEDSPKQLVVQVLGMLLGIGAMWALLFF